MMRLGEEGLRCSQMWKGLPPPTQCYFLILLRVQVLTTGTVSRTHKFFQFLSNYFESWKRKCLGSKTENCKMKLLNILKGKLDESLSFCITKHCIFHVICGYIFSCLGRGLYIQDLYNPKVGPSPAWHSSDREGQGC